VDCTVVGACGEAAACRTKHQAGRALGLPQCTRGAWAGHIPAHTWRLGSVGLGTSGTWVMTSDSRGIGRASGPMINGSSVRTQFYWVLHQDSMFMGLRILNIIIYFRNMIIFIIINIINKIINKFERKSYYLYYNFFGIFYKNKE
jgi:hypothetical protein